MQLYKVALFGGWHAAAYARQKRLPDLATIMRKFNQPINKPLPPRILLNKLRMINVALGGKDLNHG